MDTQTYIIIGLSVILILAIGILFFVLWRRKKKSKTAVPQEILNDFEQLEKIYAEHNGQKSHQEILWDYYKDKHMNKLHPTIIVPEETKSINDLSNVINNSSKRITPNTKPQSNFNDLFRRRF